MSWQTSKNRRTVYRRSQRLNGKRTTEYLGSGPRAHLAAQLDETRALRRRDSRLLLAEFDTFLHAFDENQANLRLLIHATLLVNGYHLHHRQWRRNRKPKTTT